MNGRGTFHTLMTVTITIIIIIVIFILLIVYNNTYRYNGKLRVNLYLTYHRMHVMQLIRRKRRQTNAPDRYNIITTYATVHVCDNNKNIIVILFPVRSDFVLLLFIRYLRK